MSAPTIPLTKVAVGDLVSIGGFTVRITRINRTTYRGTIINGQRAGWSGRWEKFRLREVVSRAVGAPPLTAQAAESLAQREAIISRSDAEHRTQRDLALIRALKKFRRKSRGKP